MKASAGWGRDLVRTILAFDRSSVEYGFALRCTVGVAIPLVVATALGYPRAGFAPAIGALIGGFTSLQGIYRSRLAIVLAVTLGMALASFAGALAAPWPAALTLLAAILGYLCGTIAQTGMPAGIAALNTTVAFILFSGLPLTPRHDAAQSALLFAGGFVQIALLLLVWPIDRFKIERRGLAASYRELADFAQSLTGAAAVVPPISALALTRQIVADQPPLTRSADVARFKRLLADAEAVRHRLGAVAALRAEEHADTAAGLAPFAAAIATQLRAFAATLDGTMSHEQLEGVRSQTVAALDAFEHVNAENAFALAVARDLTAHLRDALQGVAVAATGHPARLLFSAVPRPRAYIESRIDWFSRDAVRLGAVLGVAMLIGSTLFSEHRGYWIALTVALVLQPDLRGTFARSLGRIGGTLIGAALAVFAVHATHGDPVAESLWLVVAAAACYLTLIPNYALFSASITLFVLVAMGLTGAPGSDTIGERLLDTAIGGTLAMLGYLALPSWARQRTRPLLAASVDAQRALAFALLEAYIDPLNAAREPIAAMRTRCWKVRTELEASVDRARLEPRRPHSIGVDRALDILGALQSFAIASMALETALETMTPAPPILALRPLRDALDRAMHEVASALREERRAVVDGSLATIDARPPADLDASTHSTYAFVLEYTGAYVRSVASLVTLTQDGAS